jgi:hypothetical protein
MPKSVTEELERVRLEREELELEDLRERVLAHRERKQRLATERARSVEEYQKNLVILKNRQARCRHRKGGKDNKFADGNSQNYSIITNTYPTGRMVISCTRCWKEVERPDPRTRKTDPDYAAKLAEWTEWSRYPTDNTPSGNKTHEIIPAA